MKTTAKSDPPAHELPGEASRPIPTRSIAAYLLITFVITWGILGMYMAAPERAKAWFGELTGQHWLFYLAVWAPAIACFIVVLCHAGPRGLAGVFSRLSLWRCHPGWYAFILIGVPALFYAGAALNGNLSEEPMPITWQALPVALLMMAFKGPIEEFGWRGLAVPLFQRKMSPFWAALVVGVIWGIWHLPAFLLSGTPQSGWSFGPFFAGSVALSVIATALFNGSGGSLLLVAAFHLMLINPLWPDAQPYDTYLFALAAVCIVCINRKQMFRREGAVQDVVPKAYQAH